MLPRAHNPSELHMDPNFGGNSSGILRYDVRLRFLSIAGSTSSSKTSGIGRRKIRNFWPQFGQYVSFRLWKQRKCPKKYGINVDDPFFTNVGRIDYWRWPIGVQSGLGRIDDNFVPNRNFKCGDLRVRFNFCKNSKKAPVLFILFFQKFSRGLVKILCIGICIGAKVWISTVAEFLRN